MKTGQQGCSSGGPARSPEWLLCRVKVDTVRAEGLDSGSDRDQAFPKSEMDDY